jgi:hypothetical protein
MQIKSWKFFTLSDHLLTATLLHFVEVWQFNSGCLTPSFSVVRFMKKSALPFTTNQH